MAGRRDRRLVLTALAVFAAVFVISLAGGDDVATPAPRERSIARDEDSAVIATSTTVVPPIERQEAPHRSPAPVTAATYRHYPVNDLVFGTSSNSNLNVNALAGILGQATDPCYWQLPGRSLMVEGSGVLAVTADPDMHRKIANVLTDMRRSPVRR